MKPALLFPKRELLFGRLVLIYQMPKIGSQTIEATLREGSFRLLERRSYETSTSVPQARTVVRAFGAHLSNAQDRLADDRSHVARGLVSAPDPPLPLSFASDVENNPPRAFLGRSGPGLETRRATTIEPDSRAGAGHPATQNP